MGATFPECRLSPTMRIGILNKFERKTTGFGVFMTMGMKNSLCFGV
jgi:hypothetical protein